MKNNKYNYLFYGLLFITAAAKLLYIAYGPLDLASDEAHYWDWSRHLDLSYYSKGPMIACTIFLGTKLGELTGFTPPNPAFWVRFFAVASSLLTGILAWLISKRLWNDARISWYSVLILFAIPLYGIGSVIMTVDNLLILFWALFTFLILQALDKEKTVYWCLAGIALGLGFLSKYTMAILVVALISYLASTKEHRHWLKRKEFFICIITAFLFSLPVFLWNSRNNWIGIRHLLTQGGMDSGSLKNPLISKNSLWQLVEFIGLQMGVISPGLFILIFVSFIKAWQVYRAQKDYRYNFLFWFGAPLGLFYLILSLHEPCQANWPAPVYFTGAVLTGFFFVKKRWGRLLKLSVATGMVLWLLAFSIDLLPKIGIYIHPKFDPTVRLRGWRVLGREIDKIYDELSRECPVFIFADRYQITSELAFYMKFQPNVYCINIGRRMNQYDLWEDMSYEIGHNAIYVKHKDEDMNPKTENSFKSWTKLPLINIWKDTRLIHQYTVFICRGYKGGLEEPWHEITY